ncbi:MAG: dihydrofolate reductase [Bacteroidota bacterium]|nr:dihydrofolate reductase [Bacteroidota bacterium]
MRKFQNFIFITIMISSLSFSCKPGTKLSGNGEQVDTFKYIVEQFADLKILRYQVPGFDTLSLKQKELVYYLSQAAIAGRDILFDQNGKYNLAIRRTLETIYETYKGDRNSDDFKKFMVYTKRVWFSNGIYHHYAKDKFIPEFSQDYFKQLIANSDQTKLPLASGETADKFLAKIMPVMFDPNILPKKVCLEHDKDLVLNSAVNFYEGINQHDAEAFYDKMRNPSDQEPISYGLNSKLVKENGKVFEKVYKIDGLYGPAIKEIVKWLEKAAGVAENETQKNGIEKLIAYYKTGSLKTWDEYNVIWVGDLKSHIDFINGFIENYEDPLSLKATWESVVNFKNVEATHRTEIISANAQWFEDHSPVDGRFKKKQVKGVSAKVINVAQLGGDCYPSTPIGINLPNADWIRKEHGSKSVTIENITYAYDQAAKGNGFLEEFSYNKDEVDLVNKYGFITDNLHTDLHECLGHGSGQLLPGVSSDALKNYQSALEEARADLFALYYLMDPKMVELKLLPSTDAAKAEYIKYIRNGLMTQLTRIQPGKNIEEAHMRNRQLIASWCFEKGKADNVIEKKVKDGKTYFVINDFEKLHKLFGELLKEIQRIKSEGDFEGGKALVENYGVKVDPKLHAEVLERYKKLNLAPYSGFINPEYTLIEKDGKITDVKVSYPVDFIGQMMRYGKQHSFLPTYN